MRAGRGGDAGDGAAVGVRQGRRFVPWSARSCIGFTMEEGDDGETDGEERRAEMEQKQTKNTENNKYSQPPTHLALEAVAVNGVDVFLEAVLQIAVGALDQILPKL